MKEFSYVFPGQARAYFGKVRDMHYLKNGKVVAITTDKISAFDVVLPRAIPGKGQVLNEIATHFLNSTKDIVPNWLISNPVPQISYGDYCEPFKVEMIARGYLDGSMWRGYKAGERTFWGQKLPDGLVQYSKLSLPILTPTTKAENGHDMNILPYEIVEQGLATQAQYEYMANVSLQLFARGQEMAREKDLILLDTKYEFGLKDGVIYLIDEVHTPDSSRYIFADGYEERLSKNESQISLSKEFVREWLMERGFKGEPGQEVPEMDDAFVQSVSDKYASLYEIMLGKPFVSAPLPDDLKEFADLMREKVVPEISETADVKV